MAYQDKRLQGPGLGFVLSRIVRPDLLSSDTFTRWYNEVHVPDILATGVVEAAWRLECLDAEDTMPYAVLYKVRDLSRLEELTKAPLAHELLPDGGPVTTFVEMDIRWYTPSQVFDPAGSKDQGLGPQAIIAGMQPPPNGADDLDQWYRREHLQQMSEQVGFRRTTRWELAAHVKALAHDEDAMGDAPKYLAIHEFDGNLGPRTQPLYPMTDWTRKVMEEAQKIEARNYKVVKQLGEVGQGL